MTTPTQPAGALDPALRQEIEKWFARRGVPQLIEDYSSERAMDFRAAPFISGWLLFGTIKDWGTRPDWPPLWNVAGIAATLAWMALVWSVVSRVRHRPMTTRPITFDMADIITIALLPALPAALIDNSLGEAITAVLGALTGIGVIYVIIGFGLIEVGAWAIERLWIQLTHIVELIAKTLPVLLILVVFLLFAAEMWEAAGSMSGLELGVVLLLLVAVAAAIVVTAFRRELREIEEGTDADSLGTDAASSPVGPLLGSAHPEALAAPPLTWLQKTNVTILVTIPQLLQAVAVGTVLMLFLVIFAILAIPGSVQEAWIGGPVRTMIEFDLLGELRTISAEMLIVSAVLGGIVGLYFSGLSISDPAYRSEGFDREVAEVRRLLAARAVYVAAVRDEQAPTEDRPTPTTPPEPEGSARTFDG